MEVTTKNPKETFALGEKLAKEVIKPGIPVFLYGNLGAGKTELVKGVAVGFGYEGRVLSPTFQLVREYKPRSQSLEPRDINAIYHADLYRLDGVSDIQSVGLEDYFEDKNAVVLVEWAERLGKKELPTKRVEISIEIVSENERKFVILEK